jgi:hypothetical protein
VSFAGRVTGTFFDPSRTFKAIADRPVWLDALIILLILVSVYTYLVFHSRRGIASG